MLLNGAVIRMQAGGCMHLSVFISFKLVHHLGLATKFFLRPKTHAVVVFQLPWKSVDGEFILYVYVHEESSTIGICVVNYKYLYVSVFVRERKRERDIG